MGGFLFIVKIGNTDPFEKNCIIQKKRLSLTNQFILNEKTIPLYPTD